MELCVLSDNELFGNNFIWVWRKTKVGYLEIPHVPSTIKVEY